MIYAVKWRTLFEAVTSSGCVCCVTKYEKIVRSPLKVSDVHIIVFLAKLVELIVVKVLSARKRY